MNNSVSVLFSGDHNSYNTDKLLEKMKEKICEHYILFHASEYYTPQFMEYLEWDYENKKKHSNNIYELEKFLKQNNSKLHIILGGDERGKGYENIKKYPIENVNFCFWTTFLLHYSYYGLEKKLPQYKDFVPFESVEKLFLCLNGKPRPHRAQLVDQLFKNNLFSDGIISWNRVDADDYKFEYFENFELRLDNFIYVDLSTIYSDKLLSKVLLNVVTESAVHKNSFFYTEKTFRTILIGQPFVILGSLNQNRGLEKFGFQLYNEIIDYYFDGLENTDDRIEGIVKNLLKLKNHNLDQLYTNMVEKIKFNRMKAMEIVNKDPLIPDILLYFYKIHDEEFIKLFDKFSNAWNASYKVYDGFNIVREILKRNTHG